jgi:hypothetical protein
MTTYIIRREGEEKELKPVTLEVEETLRKRKHKRKITPSRSLKVWNHSPTGFEFGYGGSGPAQLALAILLDYTNNNELAVELHQAFKWKHVGRWDHPGAIITGQEIDEFIRQNRKTEKTDSETAQ